MGKKRWMDFKANIFFPVHFCVGSSFSCWNQIRTMHEFNKRNSINFWKLGAYAIPVLRVTVRKKIAIKRTETWNRNEKNIEQNTDPFQSHSTSSNRSKIPMFPGVLWLLINNFTYATAFVNSKSNTHWMQRRRKNLVFASSMVIVANPVLPATAREGIDEKIVDYLTY